MEDQQRGIYDKYTVTKKDGTPLNGDCFILRPDRDPAARVALLAYARATTNPALAVDLRQWLDSLGTPVGDGYDRSIIEKVAAEATDLVQRLIMRYEFNGDTDEANPCDWCEGGVDLCDKCRRATGDTEHGIAFELDVSAITGGEA